MCFINHLKINKNSNIKIDGRTVALGFLENGRYLKALHEIFFQLVFQRRLLDVTRQTKHLLFKVFWFSNEFYLIVMRYAGSNESIVSLLSIMVQSDPICSSLLLLFVAMPRTKNSPIDTKYSPPLNFKSSPANLNLWHFKIFAYTKHQL